MSDSGDNERQGGGTLEHQSHVANTGSLVSVHVGDLHVSTTQENEAAEPNSGEQTDNRGRTNRPVDSARLSSDADAQGKENRLTGPRRMRTAPVSHAEIETQQSLEPLSVASVQGVPTEQEGIAIDMENSCVCGLFQGKSMDGLWRQGGSLKPPDNDEQVIIAKGARFGDCCHCYGLLVFFVVTNKRFMVKQLKKICCFNLQSREESYHFSDLQHVAVERGLGVQRARNRAFTVGGLSAFIAIGFGFGSIPVLLPIIALVAAIPYAIYNIFLFCCLYNVNFLVIDVARPNPVGSWTSILGLFTKGQNYHNIRVALRIEACFAVMKELLKKHPSLPLLGDNLQPLTDQ